MKLTPQQSPVKIASHLEAAEAALHRATQPGPGYVAPTWIQRLQGHIAAGRWMLGQTPAPLTNKTSDVLAHWNAGTPPTSLAIMFEVEAVEAELFPGHRVEPVRTSGHHESWLRGVELTLDWALGRDDRNPLAA
jgi:hypothetical protein